MESKIPTAGAEGAGLERKLSPINVWALAFGCIIGFGAFVLPGNSFLAKAGPAGTGIAMALAGLIMTVIAFNYHFMIRRFPIAGGEFTYTRRAFGERQAFVGSWFLSLTYLLIVPMNATALALIGRNLLHDVFQVGFHYSVAGYDVYLGELLLAAFALILFALLSIRGVDFAGVFQTVLVFLLVSGVAVVAIAALIRPEASLAHLTPGFSPASTKLGGISAILAITPFAFVGFDTVPQAAEEYRFSPNKTKVIMVVSILFGAAVYIILDTVAASVVPEGYANWTEYIGDLDNLNGIAALPTFHAAYRLLGTGGLVFIGLAVTAAILTGIVGFYMATSRLLFAMSREKVLPAWFGKLSKHNTPVNAILFILGISLIAPCFGRTALGWLVDMSSIGAALGYGYTSAAALKFAREEGETGTVITGALGIVFSIIFAALLFIPIPMFNCSLGRESWICLIVWIILGIIFYFPTRKRMAQAD